jgi:hypothetical protein
MTSSTFRKINVDQYDEEHTIPPNELIPKPLRDRPCRSRSDPNPPEPKYADRQARLPHNRNKSLQLEASHGTTDSTFHYQG